MIAERLEAGEPDCMGHDFPQLLAAAPEHELSAVAHSNNMDEIEALSLDQSRERFASVKGEATADVGLLLADGLLYAVSITSIAIGLSDAVTGFSVSQWDIGAVNPLLVACGAILWLCALSLNDFKRLLPLWLRGLLGLGIGPKEFSEQSDSARKRRVFTMMVASPVTVGVWFELQRMESGLATRSGVPFSLVVLILAGSMALLALHWHRMIRNEREIEVFD